MCFAGIELAFWNVCKINVQIKAEQILLRVIK